MTHVRQLLIDAYDCEADLHDKALLIDAMRDAALSADCLIQGEAACAYVPHGLTLVLFLAESHLMVTTWPEERLALIDVAVCDPRIDLDALWTRLNQTLKATRCERQLIHRARPSSSAR